MPSSTIVRHNDRILTFNEDQHSYADDTGKSYTSVTRLIGMGFEKFDAVNIAKRKAEREGLNWQDLVIEWKEAGEKAANAGTRLHQNCEYQILGQEDRMNEPLDVQERINFNLAYEEVKRIKNDKYVIKLEPEKIIFSPSLNLAGSVDLLVSYESGDYIIYDWKNIKGISAVSFNGKCGILDATHGIPDSNYWHYALQLQIYEIILKVEGYIPNKSNVRRILNCFINGRLEKVELPDVKTAAKELIKWLNRR